MALPATDGVSDVSRVRVAISGLVIYYSLGYAGLEKG